MANYYKIKTNDISNGDGVRVSIFFTGCDIHCKGCFNEDIWDHTKGTLFDEDAYNIIKENMTEYKRGLSVLGGEPFSIYNRKDVDWLVHKFKEDFPDKSIYVWSGYYIDQLRSFNDDNVNSILNTINTLVDGPFLEEFQDYNLYMRGSSNQHIIKLN